ncbi:MAG: ribosome biogenesis GTP-binding protein YihA/YsxC [Bacteroidota bacterium]
MIIKQAEFLQSASDYKGCPKPTHAEYAFIGRSNVGKSSLINMLVGRNSLAKTSQTPGKTQLINHFMINNQWYLVDLPGYGYARVSKDKRSVFKGLIYNYLEKRENLECIFVLIDSRLEPQKIDMEFIEWLATKGLPFVMVFTKADKLSKTAYDSNIAKYNKQLRESWEELPPQFHTSAVTKKGQEEILALIAETNQTVKERYH